MNLNRFRRWSLKSKVTVFTLAVFVISFWSLALYVNAMLRASMQHTLGEQQLATVSLVGAQVDQELKARKAALVLIAGGIDASLLDQPAALQRYVEARPILQQLFNAGVFVTRLDGTALAEFPRIGRVGLNYMDRDHVAAALGEGKASIGKPVIGKRVVAPSFAVTVPIRDSHGGVIGALSGATDMTKPGFLDSVAQGRYGNSGGYLIVDPRNRLFVTASNNKHLVMRPLPAPGVNRVLDRRLQGFDGSAVNVSSLGVEVLTSSARIPEAGWFVIATLPTAEAFAPIDDLRQHVLFAAFLFTALAGGLTWWMLRRQLAPIAATAKALFARSDAGQPPQPLPITRDDEIGDLIGGFNRLLEMLAGREEALRAMTHRHEAAVVRSGARVDALLELPRIADAADEAGFMRGGLELIEQLTGSEVAFIHLVHGDQQSIELVTWSRGTIEHYCRAAFDTHYPVDKAGVWADALRTRAPVVVNDYATAAGCHGLPEGHAALNRFISVPVIADGLVQMIAGVGNKAEPYTEADVESAQLVANAIWRVVSERRAVVALRKEQQLFRSTFEQAAVGFAVVATNGQWLEVNQRLCDIVGYTAEELKKLNFGDITYPDDLDADLCLVRSLLDGEKGSYQLEKRYLRKDGSMVWANLTVALVREDDGKPEYFISVVEDITSRKSAEAQLHKLSAAVEQSSESIVITDLDGNIEYANAAALSSSGYRHDEIVGRNPRIFQSGKTPPETYRALWGDLEAGRAWKGHLTNQRKDGSEYVEFASIQPIRDRDGGATHYLAVKDDVTEKMRMSDELDRHRHRLEELVESRTTELASAKVAAEAANRAKSAFLANMSHEIRTPMNGVVGLIDVLSRTNLTSHQADLAETIRDSAFALLRIIGDILDFSKIEAGRLDLDFEPTSLLRTVEGVCDSLQPVAESLEVRLDVFVDPALPDSIQTDPVRLRQILNNLIANAVKFSSGLDRPGRVGVRVEPVGAGSLRLAVSDNGIGMSAEMLGRIFQPFTQAENATTRRYGGTGLGLTICRRLVDLFEGTIQVQSEPGRGSSFVVTLPIAGDGAQTPPVPAHDLSGIDCHVVAGDPVQAGDWCAYLACAGARARPWPDLASLRAHLALPPTGPQAAIVSAAVGSPMLILESTGGGDGNLGVVLVGDGRRRSPRVRDPGVVEVDGDAMHRDSLLEAVALSVGRTLPAWGGSASGPGAGVFASAPGAGAASGRRPILVAEDNVINQKVICHQLALLNFDVEVVGDGVAALERWRAGDFGLLITDLHMPRMDGYELAAAIRRDETAGSRRPIIALTANAMKEEIAQCRAAGIDDCLTKPVLLGQLDAALARWLGAAPQSDDVPVSAAPDAGAGSAFAVLDPSVLARVIGDDPVLQAEFQRHFLVLAQTAEGEIRAAAAAADWSAVTAIAHRLKSSARTVGALALGEACAGLEQAGEGRDGAVVTVRQSEFGSALAAAGARLSELLS